MGGVSVALEYEGDGETTIEPWVTPDQLEGLDADAVDLSSVCAVATELLYLLSGSQFGVREKVARPIWSNNCWSIDRLAENVRTGIPNTAEGRSLALPGPVRAIEAVKIDGLVLDPSEDTLLDRRYLVRVGGFWPMNQDLSLPDTALGTFSVAFVWGKDVPAGGRAAAKAFAKQLGLYMAGKKCNLSDRLSTVTRQGTTRTYLDPSEFTRLSRTGLYLVDTWLATVNPSGARRRPRVFSPDDPRKARYT